MAELQAKKSTERLVPETRQEQQANEPRDETLQTCLSQQSTAHRWVTYTACRISLHASGTQLHRADYDTCCVYTAIGGQIAQLPLIVLLTNTEQMIALTVNITTIDW